MGLAQSVYGRIERGAMMPSVPTLRKLCLTLGISSDALLSLSGQEAAAPAAVPQPGAGEHPELSRIVHILRHSDSAITTEVYGHLDVEDMRKGLNQLAFGPAASGPTEAVPQALLAAGAEPSPLAASLLLESGRPKK